MAYLHLSLNEIHQLLVEKKVTPLDLVNEAIAAIKNDDNNAIEFLNEENSINEAKKLIEPEVDNLFWGIPFACKDNISTKDIPTCASSEILKGYVPIFNATIVEKLLEKKAILIAKVTLDELAMGGTGSTGHLGKTFNPYDKTHTRMIGGSSCGSASIVASGILPYSLGSDTGDSIRKPASYSGLVGLKPTWGRISRFGLFPFTPSLDSLGFFTRNVFDCAALLELVSGKDSKDVTSSDRPVDKYTANLDNDIKGRKIAVVDEIIESISDVDILNKFNETLKIYESMGAIINHVHVDKKLLLTLFPTYYIISCAESTSNNANLDGIKFGLNIDGDNYQDSVTKVRTKGFSERIKRRFIIGSFSLMKENVNELYIRALKNKHLVVNAFNKILEENDVLFMPAAPNVAPLFDDNKTDKLKDEYLIADNYMVIANFGGYPSMTIPCGFKDNLPFGFNFTSKIFNESVMLNIAKKLEDKLGLKDLSVRSKK